MRFVLLREAGGLGDVVRTLPVARGLKRRYPDARVEYVALAGYEGLVKLSPDVDAVHAVSERERRGRDEKPDPAAHAYLQRFVTGEHAARTRFIDLYCPAYRHEVRTEGAVTLDRVELFCRAAGVDPSTPRIIVPAAEKANATADGRRWTQIERPSKRRPPSHLRSSAFICGSRCRRIGLAPYATHAARSWLGKARLVELARALRWHGVRLVFFHSWKGPRPGRDEGSARDIGATGALRLPWPELAAAVAGCDLVISADSGIFHLAGALGVPALGLFGPTSGEIMCRPYPTHTWITASLSARERPPGCRPPCYCRGSRGYSPDLCGKTGCKLLWQISPAEIVSRLRPTASTTKTPRSPRTATAEGGGDGHDSRSQTSRRSW